MMDDKYATRRFDIEKEEKIDTEVLETLEFKYKGRRTVVELITDEFTSVCPWTGLPDFAKLIIRYIPNEKLVEQKSLKYYLTSFRNVGILQEHVVNRILEDLVKLLDPIEMEVIGEFNARGGIATIVRAKYTKDKGFE